MYAEGKQKLQVDLNGVVLVDILRTHKGGWVMEDSSEFDGGIISPVCPNCGQFCKIPDTYMASHKKSYAVSYCKRCKKKVELSVEYI